MRGFLGFFFLLLSSLFFGLGCDDSSGVGPGLVEDEGGDPVRVRLSADTFEPEPVAKLTGSVRSATAFTGQVSSTLAGTVDDPLLGRKQAEGFIDFRSITLAPAFSEQPLDSVELHLAQTYVYGDTSGPYTMSIYAIPDAWDPTDVSSDSTFTVGERIMDFTYSPSDTLLIIPLPEAWIEANNSLLRSETFNTDFHGFHFKGSDAGAVSGFDASASELRLISSVDTINFVTETVFTHVISETSAQAIENRLVLQDGVGDGVRVRFDFSGDSLRNGALNRAVLRFQVDTATFNQGLSPTFVRPPVDQLNLYGVTADGEQQLLRTAVLGDDGQYSFASTTAAATLTLLRAIQQETLGAPLYTHFLLAPLPSSNTLNATLLFGLDQHEQAPEAILTLIP